MSDKAVTYHIEPSKSARAKCKKCKEKIESGVLRIAYNIVDGDKNFTSYHHTKCFTIPRTVNGSSTKGMTVADFVEEHIADPNGIYDDEDKLTEIIADIEAKAPKGEKSNVISEKIATYKKILEGLEEKDDDGKPSAAKKAKTDLVAKTRAYAVYKSMKIPELQDILRWNLGYGTTGTKDILLLRCIDGHVNGRLARCPVCSQGKLNLSDEDAGDTIQCGGYWDEDMNIKIRCTYSAPSSSAPRLKPWYAEEPTEEQKEKMKEFTNQQIALATGKSPDGPPSELLEAAVNIVDWPDTSNPSQRKKSCDLMYEMCTSRSVKIDFPEDEKKAKQKIFTIISANKGPMSTTDVLIAVIKEFGIAAAKAEAKAKQASALATVCNCAANAAVLQAFQELSELYFKSGNSNAGISSKKVCAAIQGLDFEITALNAIGLSKGKTKVANIGKSSAEKILEFLQTGKMQKLEEKRMLAE